MKKVYIIEDGSHIYGVYSTYKKAKKAIIKDYNENIKDIRTSQDNNLYKEEAIQYIQEDIEKVKSAETREIFNEKFRGEFWIYEMEINK